MSLPAGSRALLTAAATLVLIAGCAQAGGASAAPTSAAATPAVSAAASPAASEAAGTAYEVDVKTDAKLGAYLTGEDGKSLYLFAHDSSGKSTCTGDCAANWPPFTLDTGETAKAGAGVTGTIGTINRADGSTQVTINGLPLYYFGGDNAAGDINGQGLGGIWHLASPAGTPVGASGSGTSPAPSKCSGYYCP